MWLTGGGRVVSRSTARRHPWPTLPSQEDGRVVPRATGERAVAADVQCRRWMGDVTLGGSSSSSLLVVVLPSVLAASWQS